MQNKGVVKFFAILFALVCAFQLSFTVVSTIVQKKAGNYAFSEETSIMAKEMSGGNPAREQYLYDSISKSREAYYLNSVSDSVVYNILIRKYTFKEVKEREINLGLDLKGGMNVTMEISVVDIVKALAGPNKQNPIFLKAIDMALQKQKDSQKDFVTLFGESFAEIDPNAKLASIFSLPELSDRITFNSSNDDVLDVIKTETNAAIDRTFNILRTRIDRFGVAQPNVQKLETAGRILIELPGIKEPDRVRKLLQGTAQLEFWETYRFSELFGFFNEANSRLKNMGEKPTDTITPDTLSADNIKTAEADEPKTEVAANDTLTKDTTKSDTAAAAKKQDQSFEEYAKENPLFAYLRPNVRQDENGQFFPGQDATIGFAEIKDTARVNNMLLRIAEILPRDLKLAWTIKPQPEAPSVLQLQALRVTSRDGSPALGGDVIIDARQDYDQNNRVEVTMSMNQDGARKWKRLTGENIGRQIAIVLDGYVYSIPNVNDEIPNGRSSITGGFSVEEAQDLGNILKAGKLPAPARIVEEAVVGPSLGKVAINNGFLSFIVAFLLVLIYMNIFYARAGFIANVALLVNVFFLIGVLASLGAVLTLPGIAGIVLTLGMAVDANVIIYERIKEEVRAGKGVRLAISDGYKNAYSAIIDGNVTTFLTGLVLYIFGSGPVQGFATTLMIGIATTLFTSILISRLVFEALLSKNMSIPLGYKWSINALTKVNFDFVGIRRKAYIISAIIMLPGIISLFVQGLNLGIDFSGGRTYVVRFDQPVNTNDVRAALTAEFGIASEVKTFGPTSQVKIATKYMIDNDDPQVDSLIQGKLFNSTKKFFKDPNVTYSDFSTSSDESKMIGILSSQKVGPTVADDIRNAAFLAVVFALIIIFIYIAIRFKKWQYGLAGVISLAHDTLITIGLYSLLYKIMPFTLEVDQAFIAAILTIIGYSINDTVIIFDRVREYNTLYPKKELKVNMNNGLNHTLSRTMNTVGTTLVVVIAIFIFGGEVIRGFTFTLIIGILFGTYSSLFVASPIAYDLLENTRKREEAKAMAKAKAIPVK